MYNLLVGYSIRILAVIFIPAAVSRLSLNSFTQNRFQRSSCPCFQFLNRYAVPSKIESSNGLFKYSTIYIYLIVTASQNFQIFLKKIELGILDKANVRYLGYICLKDLCLTHSGATSKLDAKLLNYLSHSPYLIKAVGFKISIEEEMKDSLAFWAAKAAGWPLKSRILSVLINFTFYLAAEANGLLQ